jgi:hypothetical protein
MRREVRNLEDSRRQPYWPSGYCCPTSTIMKVSGFGVGRRETAPGAGGCAADVN